jgi:CheY-like chemotaxis protein
LILSEQSSPRPPTVLVVEDEFILRDMVAGYLRETGWKVLEAASGEDALAHLDQTPGIDIVFTDIRLNGTLNGWDVGEACRRKISDLPVIYATGYSITPPRKVDGSLFFNKPYAPEQIRRACEELIAARGRKNSAGGKS